MGKINYQMIYNVIESIILVESFKDAQIKFSTIASSEEVKQYIDKFKELSKKNIIKGQDKVLQEGRLVFLQEICMLCCYQPTAI